MKHCRTLSELIKDCDKEVTNILVKRFSNLLKFYPLEDLKGDLYLHFHKKKFVEQYRPLEVAVNLKTGEWIVKRCNAKFSTYLCKGIFNYIYAYHNKINPDDTHDSYEDYREDTGYKKDNTANKITLKYIYNPTIDSKIFINNILDQLKEYKTKGSIIGSSEISVEILKVLSRHGEKGCTQDQLESDLKNRYDGDLQKEISNNEYVLSRTCEDKKVRYALNNDKVERRSLYNLFKLYMCGFTDKDISKKFGITVAGVGALKRVLKKKINYYNKEYELNYKTIPSINTTEYKVN